MRLALMELAARGFLTTRREGNFLRRKVFVRRTSQEEPERGYLAEILAAAGGGSDVAIGELFDTLRDRFGRTFEGLVAVEIRPELTRRGLLEERREKMLGVIPVTRTRLTAAGEEQREALRRQVQEGSRLPKLLKVEPGDAVALAAALGPVVLLVPEMRGNFQDLATAMRASGGSSATDPGLVYWGGFDSSGDFDSDFDSLDRSFDAFDSDGGDAGGDGGGDGGGD